ncbi:hypothetical protein N0824_03227 [Microcystis sp. 0824]|nr:hypothetical protein N0824_03227 [Microcystis sp. 0824]
MRSPFFPKSKSKQRSPLTPSPQSKPRSPLPPLLEIQTLIALEPFPPKQ